MYRRKVMGVMVVQNGERRAYTEAAESFLVTLCARSYRVPLRMRMP